MKLKGKHYFDIFWIMFFAVIMITSFGYNAKARLIPLVVSIPCLLIALYRLYEDLTSKDAEGATIEDMLVKGVTDQVKGQIGEISLGKKGKEKVDQTEKKRRFFDIALWIALFLVLIFSVGFLYAIPAFTFAYMRVKKESWMMSGLSAAGITAGVYLAFIIGTKSYLYEGLLIPLIRGWLQ